MHRLVHFRGANCPPCDATTAIMARYDPAAFPGVAVRMAEVDVDQNRALLKRFRMLGPTIVLFRNRKMYVYPHHPLAVTPEASLEAMVAFAQQTYASTAELDVPGMLHFIMDHKCDNATIRPRLVCGRPAGKTGPGAAPRRRIHPALQSPVVCISGQAPRTYCHARDEAVMRV